jgi:RNA polymerase sigma-70 factor (ECF subfamily)
MAWVSELPGKEERLDIVRLARDHYDLVFRFCARRVGLDLAADAAQETFLTAQRVLGKFRGDSAVTTWLLGIANNECRRQYRKRRFESPLPDDLFSAETCEAGLVDREAIRAAMERLSEDHRQVVLLHEVDGLTYEEAAVVLGVPAGTVKSRLHHAMGNLRRDLFGDST